MKRLKHNIKKGMAFILTLAMVAGLVPAMSGGANEAQAATASGSDNTPSVSAYATKTQLMTSFTPGEDGTAANYGKIVFGKKSDGTTPQEWYILGKDDGVDGDNTIIFAASPIATEKIFDDSNTNYLKTYNPSYGTYPLGEPKTGTVYPNHYGGSELRKMLQDMVEEGNTTYFTNTEQNLMNSTTVTTRDEKKNNNLAFYTTTDKLYVLAKGDDRNASEYKIIKAGTGDRTALNLDCYWEKSSGKQNFWLRTGLSSQD